MEAELSALLAGWESFYVIVGSASAALTGLQFVVLTLSTETDSIRSDSTTSAFATPTIVHFCAVLLISAILSAPWSSLAGVSAVFGVAGLVGVIYGLLIVRNTIRQNDYKPVLEDWIFHCALPLIAYAAWLITALLLQNHPVSSMFMFGGISLLLLFIGIHNAWDAVVYIALSRRKQQEKREEND